VSAQGKAKAARTAWAWVAGIAFGWLALAAHAADDYRLAPRPDWVHWQEPPALGNAAGSDRVGLLVDDQVSLVGKAPTWFHRRVTAVTSGTGAAAAGEFSVEFDPVNEQVALHGAWVERDGRREDRLDRARIETLRREDGLESGLIDGRRTLHVMLDDIRVGDIIDFSVSVHGQNPAMAGQFYTQWSMQVGVPTRLRRLRLLHPQTREVPVRVIGAGLEHREKRVGDTIEHEWTRTNARAQRGEDYVSPWFDAGPTVEIGGMVEWGRVVQWALPFYRGVDDPAIASLATELGLKRGDSSETAVRRAIAFVQDEIRYTGLELGAHAYQPYPPSEVIRRRYGDCKDKAVLLVGLLRHLGVEAAPALVNSSTAAHVADRLPTPEAFDHVIVRLVHEGTEYWIDATAEMQRGRLSNMAQADFGRALVIAPGEDELRPMKIPLRDDPNIDIAEEFDLRGPDGGLAEDGDYSIRTVYRGAVADTVRRRFARNSPEEVGEDYTAAVAVYYPSVEQTTPPQFSDDPESNEVTVVESYRLAQVWEPVGDDEEGTHVTFWLTELSRHLPEVTKGARRSPWNLGNRIDVRQKTTVQLDGGWPEDDATRTVDGKHVKFERTVRNDGDVLTMQGRLRTLVRDVPAAEVRQLARDVEKADDAMGYELTLGADAAVASNPSSSAASNPAAVFAYLDWRLLPIALGLLLLWAWVLACALTRSESVWLGVLFRPRATAQHGLARANYREALLLCVLAAASILVEDGGYFDQVDWTVAGVLRITVMALGMIAGLIVAMYLYAALLALFGRWFGGKAGVNEVWLATTWNQVPMNATIPLFVLLMVLYGPGATESTEPAAGVATGAIAIAGTLPMAVFAFFVWFPMYAQIQGFTLRRAVVATLAPVLAVGVVVLLAITLFNRATG
jgi:transglutaminase-like putative cysteine protease